MSNAVQERVSQFPMDVRQAGEQLVAAQLEQKQLEKRIEGLKKFLADNMPPLHPEQHESGSVSLEIQGVKRTAWLAPSTKWTDVIEKLKEEVIPKTKWDRADAIKGECTTLGYREKFTVEEE